MSENDDTRTLGSDGTQTDSEQLPGQAGPPISSGGDQEPGGPVPPYEGRQTSGTVDEGGGHRDGANVGGATSPKTTDGMTDPDPSDTEGGREWSPSDEMPATEGDTSGERPSGQDPDVGPDHYSGTGKGEDQA